jgi:hypothetical protein
MTGPLDDFDSTDRILLGACVAAWLAALGAGVAAVVALVDLGRSHTAGSDSSGTPWLLYTVIGISAVVIVGAVPLLLRARAQAGARQHPQSPRGPVLPAPSTSGHRVVTPPGDTSEPPLLVSRYGGDDVAAAAVEQVWLRYTLATAAAIGAATAAIGIGTYLMATESDLGAWICYGVAGLITVAMVALPIVALRQLDELTAA